MKNCFEILKVFCLFAEMLQFKETTILWYSPSFPLKCVQVFKLINLSNSYVIHVAHGYLISQFLSPHHNRRQDQWGDSLENRMSFILETYTAIRAVVGKDFLVGVKLNSANF